MDGQDPQNAPKSELAQWVGEQNLCDHIDDDKLTEIGQKICEWYDEDEDNRTDWRERNDQWLKLATQVIEKKTYPWPNSANVKFPLLTTAAMQFAARAYPALVPGPNLVQGLVVGTDEGGQKNSSAQRIGKHMSYQLLFDMKNWEADMDRLCFILPIVGCLFKKTYFDPRQKKNVSDLIMPNDFVLDYYAKTVEDATRKTHVLYLTKNKVHERVKSKIFRKVELQDPVGLSDEKTATRDKIDGTREPSTSPATPYKFLECHTFWDLDDDGYAEPYIITVHYDTRQVVRIKTRFHPEDIEENDKGEIIAIKPTEYFTKFGFIPNPDGSIYDLGFGLLLGAINESVNTLTNQLLDAGTLNNLQGGFLGRGIRVRSGGNRFAPGEWKPVDFTGDDIKKHIFPIPTKEPSEVLFKLLETLVSSGKELASVAEIFVGKMPGQNTPATTTMATIEQGLKVFTAIHKRIYRSLGEEYGKLFLLNSRHLPDQKIYFTINEPTGPQQQMVEKQDYNPQNIGVKPFSDPNIVSSAQKLMKVQSMGPLLQIQTINPQEYTKRFLEAIEEENIGPLLQTQPQPNPEQQKMQAEMMLKQQDAAMKKQEMEMKQQFAAMEEQRKQREADMELRFKALEMQLKEREGQQKLMQGAAEHSQKLQHNAQMQGMERVQAQETHQQDLRQSEEVGQAKIQQMKAQANAKPKNNGARK